MTSGYLTEWVRGAKDRYGLDLGCYKLGKKFWAAEESSSYGGGSIFGPVVSVPQGGVSGRLRTIINIGSSLPTLNIGVLSVSEWA